MLGGTFWPVFSCFSLLCPDTLQSADLGQVCASSEEHRALFDPQVCRTPQSRLRAPYGMEHPLVSAVWGFSGGKTEAGLKWVVRVGGCLFQSRVDGPESSMQRRDFINWMEQCQCFQILGSRHGEEVSYQLSYVWKFVFSKVVLDWLN